MSPNLADEPTLVNVLPLPSPSLPPIWNWLMKKWQLCVSIPSMRTHSKQSFDEKVTGDVLPPHETASENNLTLCVSIPSMRTHLKQSFDEKLTGDVLPPPFETARTQSDLFFFFFVVCYHYVSSYYKHYLWLCSRVAPMTLTVTMCTLLAKQHWVRIRLFCHHSWSWGTELEVLLALPLWCSSNYLSPRCLLRHMPLVP